PEPGDYLLIPGIDFSYLADPNFKIRYQQQLKWIRDLYQQGVNVCSICTGAFVLGYAQLLNQRQCTTHCKFLHKLQENFPQAQLKKQRLFVEADGVYSSAGVSAGIDLSLHLLEKEFGKKLALDIAREIVVYLRRNAEDPQLSPFLRYRNHMDERVQAVQEYIYHHLEEKLTITQLAQEVFVTPRHLSRIFKAATGMTVLAYIRTLRQAQKSMESNP
ncbi:MAG: DJ-1/PfpI family protein, partial [Bacteroidota bacterium]